MSKWIPVSEKLPKEDGEYLCTIQIHNGTRVVRMTSFAKDLYAIDNFDFYDKKGKAGWFDYDDGGYYEVSDVIAWDKKFKLPAPYQEKEEKK